MGPPREAPPGDLPPEPESPLDLLAQAMPRRRVLALFSGAAAASVVAACVPDAPLGSRRREPALASANALPPRLRARDTVDGRGATLRRLFPAEELLHLDPFVLLDDFAVSPPAGFPMHPHRGFEAFTYMLDGRFRHTDNLGNESEVSTGGTQRFTSGSGAWHSEMPGAAQPNRGLQLWVNLPRRLKRMDPEYAAVHGPDLPDETRGEARVRTVVGAGSPVALRTDVRYLDLALRRGARHEDEVPPGWKGLVYVVEGALRVGDRVFREGEAALASAGELGLRAESGARAAVILGRPHGEPILHHGPFVD